MADEAFPGPRMPRAAAALTEVAYLQPRALGDKPPPQQAWTPPAVARAGPLVCETDWGVVDHVCATCFGRLLGRVTAEMGRFYRCSNCGRTSAEGVNPLAKTPAPGGRWTPAICACHMRQGGRDVRIRCTVNDRQSPSSPSEVVARQT